jgi:hypothetical protein
MASFFISHSRHDAELASRVRTALVDEGFASVFLDFHPEGGIPPGHAWEQELYAQLRKADVVIFLGTEAAVRSCWCHTELALARSLGCSVLPVLLNGDVMHPLLEGVQAVRMASNVGLRAIVEAVERIGIVPLDTLAWDPGLPPYPGLLAFDERWAGVFFGREPELAALLERLTWPMADSAERLILVVGASGSGKSSLVRAGVVPRLRRIPEGWVVVPPFTPEGDPTERLARSLATALSAAGSATSWQDCQARLERDPDGLAEIIHDVADATGDARNVLLVVDQGEQLVTRCTPQTRAAFIDRLAAALERGPTTRVVMTLRSEYLSGILASTALEGQAATTMPLGRLASERLAEVIEKPARRAGLEFEAGLVTRMVEETRRGSASGGDALPLLAFLLRRLYDRRTDRAYISGADYEQMGGVAGALKLQADRIHAQLAARERGGEVVPTLLALVHLEADRDPTGRGVPASDFDSAGQEVVTAFVAGGLLTSEGAGPTIRVAHEALLTEWLPLSRAIEQSRDDLLARSRLERDAREWAEAGRDPSYLIGGGRLRAALRSHTTAATAQPDPLASRFLAASRRQAGKARWRTRALYGLLALVLVAVAAGAVAYALDRAQESSRRQAAAAPLITIAAGAPGRARIDEHEVTYAQYRLCVIQGVCHAPPSTGIGPDFDEAPSTAPLVFVDAGQARTFCIWIDRRLPTLEELRAGAFAKGVAHLLEEMEGREWTSTRRGIALQTIARDRQERRVDVSPVNGGLRDLDLGFRCAA